MSGPEDPYVRVYQRIVTDPKFESVYGDDHLLATWLRLLLVADQMWPVPAPIPKSIRDASMRELVRVGLVDLMPRQCYRIHGLDAERSARRNAARIAAGTRWSHASGIDSPRPSPRPSNNGSQSDFDRRVEATQREIRRVRGEA